MLYLNRLHDLEHCGDTLNLTLTSVVFEYNQFKILVYKILNLTLTSVVFEFYTPRYIITYVSLFNFNKCCIWIIV